MSTKREQWPWKATVIVAVGAIAVFRHNAQRLTGWLADPQDADSWRNRALCRPADLATSGRAHDSA